VNHEGCGEPIEYWFILVHTGATGSYWFILVPLVLLVLACGQVQYSIDGGMAERRYLHGSIHPALERRRATSRSEWSQEVRSAQEPLSGARRCALPKSL
jgi:hypothetical protein